MNLFSAAVAQAAALPLPGLLPPPALAHRSVVIVAAGGRDLLWPQELIASALLQRSGGRPVHLLLHGGARGADQAIAAAAHRLGWAAQAIPAQWARYGIAAGPVRNGQMLRRASEEATAYGRISATGVLVIAFPGRKGTASLLDQARRLQGRTPLPIEILDLGA